MSKISTTAATSTNALKRKIITVELPKPRDLSKNRLSVFQRLGTKKLKEATTAPQESIIVEKPDGTIIKQPKPFLPAVQLPIKTIENKISDHVELEDADPDLLERKRAELQKELAIQLKMESARKPTKEVIRRRKKVRSSSSSSSSSSDSGSSSDSSSSSSSRESRRKTRKPKGKRRNSSSSSDGPRIKKVVKTKRVCHKKIEASGKLHKSAHAKKLLAAQTGKLRKRTQSPVQRKRLAAAATSSPSSHKLQAKSKLSVDNVAKHHRLKEAAAREKEREREFQLRERERSDRDRERPRSRERGRSRTPKLRSVKSRSPKRYSPQRVRQKSPQSLRRASPPRSSGSRRRDRSLDHPIKKDLVKRHESSRERERERLRKDQLERERLHEEARDKERAEILAKCQARHQRERLAKMRERGEIIKPDRLLPRPAERERALAAARDRSREKSVDRPRSLSHSGRERSIREKDPYERVDYERDDPRYDHRMDRRLEKEDRGRDDRDYMMVRRVDNRIDNPYLPRDKRTTEHDLDRDLYHGSEQRYDDMRDDRRHDYASRGYVDERHRGTERGSERDWIRENEMGRVGGAAETDRSLHYDRQMDRHQQASDWDRGDMASAGHGSRDNYHGDQREWTHNDQQWDGNRGSGSNKWVAQDQTEENWDNELQDYNMMAEKPLHREGGTGGAADGMPRGGGNRRWTNWRGRRGNQHHSGDFRRQNLTEGGFHHDRPDPYRRVNTPATAITGAVNPVIVNTEFSIIRQPQQLTPKAVDSVKPATTVPPTDAVEPIAAVPTEPSDNAEATSTLKLLSPDEKDAAQPATDGEPGADEAIPDDLSEISDDADEILNRQEDEETLTKNQLLSSTAPILFQRDHFIVRRNDASAYGILLNQSFRPDYEPEEKSNQALLDAAEMAGQSTDLSTTVQAAHESTDAAETIELQSALPADKPTDVLNDSVKDLPVDDMDLDFEEISDGELEEEARIRGLGDALGVDWASLVEESKAIVAEKTAVDKFTTAKQRWQPHRILLDIGISFKMAGEKFALETLQAAKQKIKDEIAAARQQQNDLLKNEFKSFEIKKEKIDNDYVDVSVPPPVLEPADDYTIKKEEIVEELPLHPVACIQVAQRQSIERRQNLVLNASGPHSRALSARRDLQMRRQLCGLSAARKFNNQKLFKKSATDLGYGSIALKLFQQKLEVK